MVTGAAGGRPPGRTRPVARALRWLGFLAVAAGGLLMLMPILWMVSTSLKPLDRVFELPIQWIPRPPRWENYPTAWNRFDFGRYFLNSFIVSVAVTILNVLLSGLAGYSLA